MIESTGHKSAVAQARRLRDTGMDAKMADAVIEIMEEILGTPLSQTVYEAKNDSMKAELLGAINQLGNVIESHKVLVSQQFKHHSKEVELREDAFEERVKAAIVRERVWLLSSVGTLFTMVAGVAARMWWIGSL